MSLISFSQLAKSFGHRDIFQNLSGAIEQGARAALVGPNGVGKSTLLKLLAGIETPSDGNVFRARGLRMGFLAQGGLEVLSPELEKTTLWQHVVEPFAELRTTAAQLHQMELQMVEHPSEQLLEEYGHLQEDFEKAGGYTYEQRVRQTLAGLGFKESDNSLTLKQLSGGQKTRANLARILLEEPEFLFLDEPTNHLDIQAVEWLENWLNAWSGTALMVSHDRYFLDKVANRIWELGPAQLEVYRGNYSHYLTQRGQRWELRHLMFETERARMLKEMEYIKRNIAGQNTAQAKGKLRRISREIEAVEQAGVEAVKGKRWAEIAAEVEVSGRPLGVDEAETRIRALRDPLVRAAEMRLNLEKPRRSGDRVLETYQLQIGYPGNPLFQLPDLLLVRGQFAAVIGPNGCGKSSLLKTLLGQLPAQKGTFKFGSALDTGYFSQAHEGLTPSNTLFDEIRTVSKLLDGQVRDHLAKFLFRGDEVYKEVRVLSGGERGRLALAKLSLQKVNLLLLDEPTNHLDIPAQEVLEQVLREFSGTVLMVSHDRYLIERLATQIWEVDGGQLTAYAGNYREYLEAKATRAVQRTESPSSNANVYQQEKKQVRTAQAAERKKQEQISNLEQKILKLEESISQLTQALESASLAQNVSEVSRLGTAYEDAQAQLAHTMAEWERMLG
jgi:ATP-binding cassette subfamily F protein 3